MNPIAEEINSFMHIGMPRRSGRYPWGSGKDPYQRSADFLSRVEALKKEGWSETPANIKEEFGLTTGEYRIEKAIAKDYRRLNNMARAQSLRDDGLSDSEIGRQMGVNESTVRSWKNEEAARNTRLAKNTADLIRSKIEEKGMIDVGIGVERELGISRNKLDEALRILEIEGYPVYGGGVPYATNKGLQVNQQVICPKDTPYKSIYEYDKVHTLDDYASHDGGETFDQLVYPKSMDSKRIMVRYDEDGGTAKDGIVEIRRGVKDLSLGEDHYAQVRILVDDTRYIKGMAVYSDDMPKGVDVIFNTNKSKSVPMIDPDPNAKQVLKPIKNDPDNPFGSLIKAKGQSYYIDKDGNRQLSLINKRASEGDWEDWKDALPSQFLGKQSRTLAKKQLGLAKEDKMNEFEEIKSLNNPTIKKHLLEEFANNCDSAAVHLKAAALPGQKYHVIIPVNTLKDDEIYAPNYGNGTKVALIRYPHGGTFEIPIMTVNNKHDPASKIIGKTSIDAVGINKSVADRLSGADFDGDTVMVIPTHDSQGKVKITSTNKLKGLEGFDTKVYQYDTRTVDKDGTEHYYRNGREFRPMKNTDLQMGVASNLITDMTLGGASPDKLARAVRHSMVVIDAEKHKLDYKQSELDNDIASLKKEYQRWIDDDGNEHTGGASTILSRAKREERVLKRQGNPKINQKGKPWYDPNKPEGSLIYKVSDKLTYETEKINKKTGEVTKITNYRTQKSTEMAETNDANTLVSSSKHPMELIYADYANSMKSLANKARLEMVNTGSLKYDPNAAETYKKEVKDLQFKLNNALLNAPKERAAQRYANAVINEKKQAAKEAGEEIKKKDLKKIAQQAQSAGRSKVGAIARRNRNIEITDREWEAIQAGAIHESKLKDILRNTDVDMLRQRATPKTTTTLSNAKINRIKALASSGKTLNEIAKALGVSTSTVSNYLKGAS